MSNEEFISLLALVILPALAVAFKFLPNERWQILAAIPSRKNNQCQNGSWQGLNITFYGVLLATGCLVGTSSFLFLSSSIALPISLLIVLAGFIVVVSMSAASFLAKIVEKKENTLTVAGGATVGLYIIPISVELINRSWLSDSAGMPLLPIMAAIGISYLYGEGIGRLACLSFGCCYGKPLSELGPLASRFFSRACCIYHGHTKKIAYASQLEGVRVIPIQAITSTLYITVALGCTYLFLEGQMKWAFGLSSIVAMGWRLLSEKYRADYRGEGKITVYQIMSIANILFCLALIPLAANQEPTLPVLHKGLTVFWDPAVLIFLQTIWLASFLFSGISKVTGSTLTFQVNTDNI